MVWLSELIVNKAIIKNNFENYTEPQILNALTKPLTNVIIQLDSTALENMVLNKSTNASIIKKLCTNIKYQRKFMGKCRIIF